MEAKYNRGLEFYFRSYIDNLMEAKYNRGLEFYFWSYIANQYFRKWALVCREGRHPTLLLTNTVKFRK